MGYNVIFIRVDEDGALAQSVELCELIVNLECIMETTGGGRSENNGAVEIGNRICANMVRTRLATLYTMIGDLLPKDMDIRLFWCYCYQLEVFTQRRLYNQHLGDTPEYKVLKQRSLVQQLVPIGSIVTAIDPSKNLKNKLNLHRSVIGYFLGFDNHIKTRYYWDPQIPQEIQRASHCVIDDVATLSRLRNGFATLPLPCSLLDQIKPNEPINNISSKIETSYQKGQQLTTVKAPFNPDEKSIIVIPIPA